MAKPLKQAPGPYLPVAYTPTDIYALQALRDGVATKGQQQQAMKFIIEGICSTYDLSYRPGAADGDRDTAFAEGKRYVGLQIVKFLHAVPNSTRPDQKGTL